MFARAPVTCCARVFVYYNICSASKAMMIKKGIPTVYQEQLEM